MSIKKALFGGGVEGLRGEDENLQRNEVICLIQRSLFFCAITTMVVL